MHECNSVFGYDQRSKFKKLKIVKLAIAVILKTLLILKNSVFEHL